MQTDRIINGVEVGSDTREVRVVFAGSHTIGVLGDEIDIIADWRTPTPLPNAPASVLGVVCIRGRMLTVLDTAALLGEGAKETPAFIVALRGDEQLALAVDRAGDTHQISEEEWTTSKERSLILGVVKCKNNTSVSVLNVNELFATAMRGRERRRRRF